MDDDDDKPLEHLTDLPYFDLNEAIISFGLDFESFKEDNFISFIDNLIIDYVVLRKNYILKDFVKVRGIAHKFKGLFL